MTGTDPNTCPVSPQTPEASGSLMVGDVLVSSGGWEQTNISFYQVVAVTPKTVVIRALQSRITPGGGRGAADERAHRLVHRRPGTTRCRAERHRPSCHADLVRGCRALGRESKDVHSLRLTLIGSRADSEDPAKRPRSAARRRGRPRIRYRAAADDCLQRPVAQRKTMTDAAR